MFAQPSLRLIFLSLFASSILLPMEDLKSTKTLRQNIPVIQQGANASCGYHSLLNSILSLPGVNKDAKKEINIKFAQENGTWRAVIIERRKKELVKNYIRNLLLKYMPRNTNEELTNDEREALNNISKAYADAYCLDKNLNILQEDAKNIPAQLENILVKHCPQINSLCHAEHDKQRTYLDNCKACIQIINFNKLRTEIVHANMLMQQACASASVSDLHGDDLDSFEMNVLKDLALEEYPIIKDNITIIDDTDHLDEEAYQNIILESVNKQILKPNCTHSFCLCTNDNVNRKQQPLQQLHDNTKSTHWTSVTLERKNGQNNYLFKDSMGRDYSNHHNVTQLIAVLEQSKHNETKERKENNHNAIPQPIQPESIQNKSAQHHVDHQPEAAHNTQQNPIQDDFKQEKDFHARIQKAHPDLFDGDNLIGGVQAYYKKINIPVSKPENKEDFTQKNIKKEVWEVFSISIAGNKVDPDGNGLYKCGNISFNPNLTNFDLDKSLDIVVTEGEAPLKFIKSLDKKIPVSPKLNSYDEVMSAMRNQISLRHYVTLKGVLRIPGGNRCVIEIECRNQNVQPIKLRGMEFIFDKNEKKTKIFFDFADANNGLVDYLYVIECKHSNPIIADKDVVRIKDHRFYSCEGKTIYGFFDSPKTRSMWIPNTTDFYDQTKGILTFLPGCYSDSDCNEESLNENVVWVFGDGNDSWYQRDSNEILKSTNKNLYSNEDGSFSATLPHRAWFKECCSNEKKISLDYLTKVCEPRIFIRKDIKIEGNRDWKRGVYQETFPNNKPLWKRLGAPEDNTISFLEEQVQFDIVFPALPLDEQQNKKWCDAAQRFSIDFPANIHHCNEAVLNDLKRWHKLTTLNLSHVRLENGSKWKHIFAVLPTMTQLTSLSFENNHPVTDFFGTWTYNGLANPASNYYLSLAACLRSLINLQELHIQGLWLKPHRYLGSGCIRITPYNSTVPYSQTDDYIVSTEVATLTGIINHNDQAGIKAIINNISRLQYLKNLSIDGIPNHGSSSYARKTNWGQLFLPLAIVTYNDGCRQDASLKRLVIDSANQLAQIATLKTISVYSPGGNCVDYFSRAFRDKLNQSRQAIKPALPKLTITAKELT